MAAAWAFRLEIWSAEALGTTRPEVSAAPSATAMTRRACRRKFHVHVVTTGSQLTRKESLDARQSRFSGFLRGRRAGRVAFWAGGARGPGGGRSGPAGGGVGRRVGVWAGGLGGLRAGRCRPCRGFAGWVSAWLAVPSRVEDAWL